METLQEKVADLSLESNQSLQVEVNTEISHLKYDLSHEILAMITLKAPRSESFDRAPLDLVAVLDQSGSMSGEKLDMVKNSMNFAISQLREDDRLAIVLLIRSSSSF